MTDTHAALNSFVQWFQAKGGLLDPSIGFTTFPLSEGGRGVVADRDIPQGYTLFSIPRDLILSTQNSSLPSRFGLNEWKKSGLHKGWTGLILCMMWEQAQGPSSRWSEYLATLPTRFDTPMFWTEEDLLELQGTSVVEKIGKEDANQEYERKIVPTILSRPDLFAPSDMYTLDVYHVMGSRILSRSFDVERWHVEGNEDTSTQETLADDSNEVSIESSMDLESNEESDDDEKPFDIAMVPMADMLNARFESENAKLFHEETHLKMVSTKLIKAGEQIWNTYGDLPNAELLRRYGHVDLLPLPQGGLGNPGDVVEIRADIIVDAVVQVQQILALDDMKERITWWLDEGGDDILVIESDYQVPPLMISLVRLLTFSQAEWEQAKGRSKPPKPIMEPAVLDIITVVLQQRLKGYGTTFEEDGQLLQLVTALNKRHAIIVRMGEKRILKGTLDKLANNKHSTKSGGMNKRKRGMSDEMQESRRRKNI
ncbi:hypothetical protein AMATHDRAFT_146943 [Amanita thiersii Skay4041]|uniref:SET domain-containing protein n=1 Tax=Amanita thiersii Skay4041 TaxID=703135 RepID=A0A2A9NN58_9AGAR|nr:hypothetical protein AMATHDRAFT_146943 [Amanita thiersii Skay4041]